MELTSRDNRWGAPGVDVATISPASFVSQLLTTGVTILLYNGDTPTCRAVIFIGRRMQMSYIWRGGDKTV